jgi:hypothetical protein
MSTSSSTIPHRYPGRLLVALGFGLSALGIVAYVLQFAIGRLGLPWYLPFTSMLGAGCVAVALWQARSVWRVLALALLLLVAGAEWAFLLGLRLPDYTGTQVVAGKPFPTFTTAKADGTPFRPSDLVGDRDTVMVFFRGRW